jgi:DNA adenine methylase
LIKILNSTAKPFLKWAGGKGQLLEQIQQHFPSKINNRNARYIEPFVGSGAVFLKIANIYELDRYFLLDINEELILVYKTIQNHIEDLINFLAKTQEIYLNLSEEEKKRYYYEMRSQFNLFRERNKIDLQNYSKDWLERTTQFIFLNRTCFNGLWRVNSQGDFNVPMGRYKNPTICDRDNLRAVARILQKTEVHCGDFSDSEQWIDNNTFIYFDPPYKPISKTSVFTAYSKQNFNDTEQLRLRDFFVKCDRLGAKLLLSNSDPKNEDPDNDFFEKAYQGYRIERVKASRNINSNAQKRGQINEILIRNY